MIELAVVIAFLLFSVLILVLAIDDSRYIRHLEAVHRRMQEIAAGFRCVVCDELLGAEAISLADEEHRRYVEELRRNNPHVKFRIVKNVHAICGNCGTKYRYLKEEERFVVKSSEYLTEAKGVTD